MEDDMNGLIQDVLANSLEGNALGVKDAVNAMMNAKALEALQAMKIDVAQSLYGTEAGEPEEVAPEELEVPEADDEFIDSTADDLFAELDQLTDDESEEDLGEYSDEESEEQYEDETDV